MTVTRHYLREDGVGLHAASVLPLIAEQAAEADRTRTIAAEVIAAIKASPLIRLSATCEIGGEASSVVQMARELEAVAAACASTAWCLWNHLCVFHFYCSQFGPEAIEALRGIVAAREWVTFPQGAGSEIRGERDESGRFHLHGKATFASGARYAEWGSFTFVDVADTSERPGMLLCLARYDAPGMSIAADWNGSAVRASATDTVHFDGATIEPALIRPWRFDSARYIRNPEVPMINHRYREDWVGLAVIWLAAQGTGVARAALDDAVEQATDRRAIFGLRMAERPGVQFNIGHAAATIAAAESTWLAVARETDERIDCGAIPDEAALLRQLSQAMVSLRLSGEAMALIQRTLGGNGLRESGTFERRMRDFAAMPVHITAHPDRIAELLGRHLLGVT